MRLKPKSKNIWVPTPPLINSVAGHIFSSGGKRIRPLLLILSARLYGFIEKDYLLLGSLIEYIHTATLLHDDVLG